MDEIQYVGLNDLEEVDKEMAQKLCEEYFDKVKRELHNDVDVKVHIKTLKKEGARHKYEIHISANSSMQKFDVSHASEQATWDLASAIHTGFKNLLTEIEHRFKQN